jgi:uncharacterized protein involved in exopolysaccharide biosynthesis
MKVQTTGRILLYSICRRWRLIVLINVIILGTILVGSWLWPPSFQAASNVVILSRTYPDLLTTPSRGQGASTLVLNPKEEINSEIEIIRSQPVLERVVKDLKLEEPRSIQDSGIAGAIRTAGRSLVGGIQALLKQAGLTRELTPQETFDAAVLRLRTKLVVEPAIDSQIIWIRYRDPDPVLASKVVNKVAEEYQYQHLSININRAESSFYAEQIEKVEKELKGLQEQLLGLRKESGIVSYSEQSKSLLKKLETYDNALTNGQKEIIRIRAKVDKIQALRKSKPHLLIPLPDLAQDPQIADLENKLVNLKFAQKTVLQRYTPESRQAATVREQIGQLQVQIRDQVSTLLERESAKLGELQAEEQAIGQTIKSIKEDLAQMPTTEMNLNNLDREIDTKRGILSILMKKYQDSLLAKSADRRLESAKVLSLASVPLKPAFPNLPLNLGLGLVLSLVVSFSAAFFLEYWDDSLKNPEDVERCLGRKAFASVPEFPA